MMIMSTRKRTVDSFHLCVFASALGKFEGKKEGGREGGNRWFSSFFRVSLKLFNFFFLLWCLNEEGRVFRDYSGALTSQAAPLKKKWVSLSSPSLAEDKTRFTCYVMLCCCWSCQKKSCLENDRPIYKIRGTLSLSRFVSPILPVKEEREREREEFVDVCVVVSLRHRIFFFYSLVLILFVSAEQEMGEEEEDEGAHLFFFFFVNT